VYRLIGGTTIRGMVDVAGAMTRDRLKQVLNDEAVDPRAYELFGGHPSESFVLDDRGAGWVVYYSERGLESGLRSFPNEDLACRHLLELLLRDPTTRLPR
jgi:hypothetical protein